MTGQNGALPPRRCQAIALSGSACGVPPMKGEPWCMRHHPARREQAIEDSRKGALAGHQMGSPAVMQWSESITWATPDDIMITMRELASLLAKNALSSGTAESIRRAGETWLKAYEIRQRAKPLEESHIDRYRTLDVTPSTTMADAEISAPGVSQPRTDDPTEAP